MHPDTPNEQVSTERWMGRVEQSLKDLTQKVDEYNEGVHDFQAGCEKKFDSLSAKVDDLNNRTAKTAGIVATIVSVILLAIQWAWAHVTAKGG